MNSYTWGLGSTGQLGHCALQSGDKELIPRRVVALDGIFIQQIACGGVHTCAVAEKGALYAWGGGQAGQLGLGPQTGFFSLVAGDSQMMLRNIPVLVVPTGVQQVACGHCHTLISTKDGRIQGWGYNSYGQAANEKSTYAWYPSPVDWYELRNLQIYFRTFNEQFFKWKCRFQVCRGGSEISSWWGSFSSVDRCLLLEGVV